MKKSQLEISKKHLWNLDETFTFLNHGSFGAMPKAIIEKQHLLRLYIESQPVRHFQRELDGLLDSSRRRLASFVGAGPEELVFVPNATTGVNTVLSCLDLSPGDEILVTDHIYNAATTPRSTARTGARVVTAHIPFGEVRRRCKSS